MEGSNSAENPKEQTTIEELPHSLFEEVLICVPFPYLSESRLVAREWNERITHQSFVERVKTKYGSKAAICVHEMVFSDIAPDVITLKLDPLTSEVFNYSSLIRAVLCPYILACVNDVVLFGDRHCKCLFMIKQTDHTVCSIDDDVPVSDEFIELYGFGYSKAESYVIMKVVQNKMENCVYVHSQKRGAWRRYVLNKFEHKIAASVGFFDGRIYFHDGKNLLGFDIALEDFWVIQLPEELRSGDVLLTFGVAREELSDQVREVLLISCQSYYTHRSNIWRLSKGKDKEACDVIAVWDDIDTALQPLAYYGGDSNQLVILEDYRSIVVYNIAERSKFQIYCQEGSFSMIDAIGFFQSSLPSLKGEVLSSDHPDINLKEREG